MALLTSTPRPRLKPCFKLLLLGSVVWIGFLSARLYTRDGIVVYSRRAIESTYWIFGKGSEWNLDTILVKMASKRPVEGAQCPRLIAGEDFNTTNTTRHLFQKGRSRDIAAFSRLNNSGNCQRFQEVRGYIMMPGSLEEEKFPIAYSIIVYKEFFQVERLLRAIYRPQNQYCVHVDLKADDEFKYNLEKLTSCFDNVFISSRTISVKWAKFSVLEADLICMNDLLKRPRWKYFINLTGQEFPLKTSWQIVRILKAYNGANDIAATIKRRNVHRTRAKEPAPHNITIVKGPVHSIMSRAFVSFIMNDQKAQDFLDWTKGTFFPDETFFATLQHNPHLGVPGAFKGTQDELEEKTSMARYKLWKPRHCMGKYVRQICIFDERDLPGLAQAPHLFANKFHFDFGELAYECLDELLWNRTRDEYLYGSSFNTTFYENLSTVKQRVNVTRDSDV